MSTVVLVVAAALSAIFTYTPNPYQSSSQFQLTTTSMHIEVQSFTPNTYGQLAEEFAVSATTSADIRSILHGFAENPAFVSLYDTTAATGWISVFQHVQTNDAQFTDTVTLTRLKTYTLVIGSSSTGSNTARFSKATVDAGLPTLLVPEPPAALEGGIGALLFVSAVLLQRRSAATKAIAASP
jgi:hypothetical protein